MGGPDPPGVQVTYRRLGGMGLGLSITLKLLIHADSD